MRCLYGNYGADAGRILLRHATASVVDLATADAARWCSRCGATRSAMSASSCA